MQKIDQGCYIATDVRWGMVLDLSSVDDQSLIAYGFHGQENQQARALVSSFHSADTGGADRIPRSMGSTHYCLSICSGSSVPAVVVSSSTASGPARSSQSGI